MATVIESASVRHFDAPQSEGRALSSEAHTLRRVLACIDGSPSSEACLHHAVAISKSLGSTITLLHVMQSPHERSGLHTTDVIDWEIAREQASDHLERLERDATRASGRPVETRLEQGHPADRIIAVARELDADLTVLGSHGERGLTAWNLGSTALQVLAVTRSSVLIARSAPTASGEVPLKRILVPLDGSVRTESVLPTALLVARAHDAELLLAFVVRECLPTAVLHAPADLDLARELATHLEVGGKRYLDDLRDQLAREGVRARTLVLRGPDERQSLLELAQRERTDLIVLSAHGSTCNPALTFGSVTAHLLTHSVVSLLVLQDLRDSELRIPENDRRAPPLRASYPEDV